MNRYECDGTEGWNVLFNEAKQSLIERYFHLSPDKNIFTITKMKNIHICFM